MARLSEFTDVTMKLILSGEIAPYKTSEEVMEKKQPGEVIKKMRELGQKKLLFIYDRGYPSESFINQHIDLDVDFLCPVPYPLF